MSDIGHKNVCREYYYVLDEVKRIMKYWKKTQYYSLWQRKKTRVKEKINCPPKITNWPVDISKKKDAEKLDFLHFFNRKWYTITTKYPPLIAPIPENNPPCSERKKTFEKPVMCFCTTCNWIMFQKNAVLLYTTGLICKKMRKQNMLRMIFGSKVVY